MIYLTQVNPDILLNGVLEKEVNLSSDTYDIYLQVYIYISLKLARLNGIKINA